MSSAIFCVSLILDSSDWRPNAFPTYPIASIINFMKIKMALTGHEITCRLYKKYANEPAHFFKKHEK